MFSNKYNAIIVISLFIIGYVICSPTVKLSKNYFKILAQKHAYFNIYMHIIHTGLNNIL